MFYNTLREDWTMPSMNSVGTNASVSGIDPVQKMINKNAEKSKETLQQLTQRTDAARTTAGDLTSFSQTSVAEGANSNADKLRETNQEKQVQALKDNLSSKVQERKDPLVPESTGNNQQNSLTARNVLETAEDVLGAIVDVRA